MPRESAAARAHNELLAAQIMEMAAAGQTLPKIHAALRKDDHRLTLSKVKKLYQAQMRRVLTAHEDIREAVFAQELENTRLLRAAIMPRALRGEPRAIEVALAVGKEYRSQLGMTEAMRLEVSAVKVEEALDKLVEIIDGADVGTVEPLRRFREIPTAEARLAAAGDD